MAEYLVVADSLFTRGDDGEEGLAGVAGLAGALASAGHKVTLLSLAPPERLVQVPGLARRLRTVSASAGRRARELPLYEGKLAGLTANVYGLAAVSERNSESCALLGSGAATLVRDGLLKPDVVVGWGEVSAAALANIPANVRLFVLPSGALLPALSDAEIEDLEESADIGAGGSLAARGVISANAVVVPSPTAGQLLAGQPALAARASDEPVVAVQLGCDEPPYDPASDPALVATYGPDALGGKWECRRALAKRLSLTLGPKTLLLTIERLDAARGGRLLLDVLRELSHVDVVVVVPAGGDPASRHALGVLSIEHPGKFAQLADGPPASRRQLLGAADAVLVLDDLEGTGRAAGLAQRYGVLPIAPDAGAFGDFLVDLDPHTATGSAILFSERTAFEIVGAIRRAIEYRRNGDAWTELAKRLMTVAPRWNAVAQRLDALRIEAESGHLAAAE